MDIFGSFSTLSCNELIKVVFFFYNSLLFLKNTVYLTGVANIKFLNSEYCISSVLVGSLHAGYQLIFRVTL